jgi:hypothetical protein
VECPGVEGSDPLRETFDDGVESVVGDGAVDPAVAFGRVRVVVLARGDDLQGAGPAGELP